MHGLGSGPTRLNTLIGKPQAAQPPNKTKTILMCRESHNLRIPSRVFRYAGRKTFFMPENSDERIAGRAPLDSPQTVSDFRPANRPEWIDAEWFKIWGDLARNDHEQAYPQ